MTPTLPGNEATALVVDTHIAPRSPPSRRRIVGHEVDRRSAFRYALVWTHWGWSVEARRGSNRGPVTFNTSKARPLSIA
jgi:hypothetical protein